MQVSEAVNARKSIRSFLSTPVPDEQIAQLLEKAARSPSGGNVAAMASVCGEWPNYAKVSMTF